MIERGDVLETLERHMVGEPFGFVMDESQRPEPRFESVGTPAGDITSRMGTA